MGKKKKGGGAEKTAAKTDKKMALKLKKNLALTGEDDIEKILAEIEKDEQKKLQVTEKVICSAPTCRAFFSLVAHPERDELIMFGGEYHNGKETEVFKDLFIYKIVKEEWSVVKSAGGPGPRSGHAAVAVPFNRGEMWVFGGEFTTKSESQFYHYNDLWNLNLDTLRWQKITSSGGPCSRSGHRMVAIKKQLILFGGYHDNLQDYKYFNDVYIFNLEAKSWHKLVPTGAGPSARSACQMVATPEGKVLVWGGYSKVKVKKDVDSGIVHSDMFLLTNEKGDESGVKWKWSTVKAGGNRPESMSGVAIASNASTGRAYIFGGAVDTDTEEDINTKFYNQLYSIDLSKLMWSQISLCGKKEGTKIRRKKKDKISEEDEEMEEEMEAEEEPDSSTSTNVEKVVDDGVFRLQVGGGATVSSANTVSTCSDKPKDVSFQPHPRINAGLVIKSSKLYLYGGIYETPQAVHTLSDFHVLDLLKCDEWKMLAGCDLTSQVWLESASESGSESEGEFDCDSDEESEED